MNKVNNYFMYKNYRIDTTTQASIVVPSIHYKNVSHFLDDFSIQAKSAEFINQVQPFLLNHWEDMKTFNVAKMFWEQGFFEKIRYSVIGITNLHLANEENLALAQEAVKHLLKNENFVFLLPNSDNEEHVFFYQTLFPEAKLLHI